MTEELLPCPFCGSTDVEVHSTDRTHVKVVTCGSCYAESGGSETYIEAVELWNKRENKKNVVNERRSLIYIEGIVNELFKCAKNSDADEDLKKRLDNALDVHREVFGEQ